MDLWSRTDLFFEKTSPLVRQFLFFKIVPCHDNTQFPAFAVIGLKTRACMMAKRIAAFETRKPSLLGRVLSENIDKYR